MLLESLVQVTGETGMPREGRRVRISFEHVLLDLLPKLASDWLHRAGLPERG